jgi:hypothetical protein
MRPMNGGWRGRGYVEGDQGLWLVVLGERGDRAGAGAPNSSGIRSKRGHGGIMVWGHDSGRQQWNITLGEGSRVPHIMDVASICASMLAPASCFARRWEKHRRRRARGMARGSHEAHLSVTR